MVNVPRGHYPLSEVKCVNVLIARVYARSKHIQYIRNNSVNGLYTWNRKPRFDKDPELTIIWPAQNDQWPKFINDD